MAFVRWKFTKTTDDNWIYITYSSEAAPVTSATFTSIGAMLDAIKLEAPSGLLDGEILTRSVTLDRWEYYKIQGNKWQYMHNVDGGIWTRSIEYNTASAMLDAIKTEAPSGVKGGEMTARGT